MSTVSAATIRIGVIGGGMMSQVGHLPFYLDDRRCEVAAVAETRPSLVAALGRRLGTERIVADHRAVLEDPTIAAVVISAPRPATGPLTLAALEVGKHVLAEKPMAHTVDQARRLVEAARRRQRLYAVGYMKRYDPGIGTAKAAFDVLRADGRLGRLLRACFYNLSRSYAVAVPPHIRPAESRNVRFAEWPQWPEWLVPRYRSAYVWFLNAASHDLNLAQFFFPYGLEVDSAVCHADDALAIRLRQSDVPVALEVSRTAADRWVEGGEFLFEQGRLSFRVPSPMAVDEVTTVRLEDDRGEPAGGMMATGSGWSFARQARGFIDTLLGEAPLRNPGEEGLSDMVLAEAIFRKLDG